MTFSNGRTVKPENVFFLLPYLVHMQELQKWVTFPKKCRAENEYSKIYQKAGKSPFYHSTNAPKRTLRH